jgi:hypothetical protein
MKIAAMMEAYADSAGAKIMHHINVAEALVQLIENSRTRRAEATEQFREAMLGYVNESIDVIKAADVADKDELAKTMRKLIEDLHVDRQRLLSGEPLDVPARQMSGAPPAAEAHDADRGEARQAAERVQDARAVTSIGPFVSDKSDIIGDADSSIKDARGRNTKDSRSL